MCGSDSDNNITLQKLQEVTWEISRWIQEDPSRMTVLVLRIVWILCRARLLWWMLSSFIFVFVGNRFCYLFLLVLITFCLEHSHPLNTLGCVFLHLFCYFLRWQSSMSQCSCTSLTSQSTPG